MEKDLLDLSGEDEDYWLLKNTPKKAVSSFAGENSYLDCSPLQIPRSNRPPFTPIGVKGSKNKEQPSHTDTVAKENTSENKAELPKLSVEPQAMKKKRKNAGFNLRKSLAWNRAFSTEEGVLDSVELSKITGNACQTRGDLLPAIQEDFGESMSASKYTSVSPGLQALEENLFNDLPVNSIKREKKKIVCGTPSKYATPSKAQSSLAQKKVISAQNLRSGSKRSGCPRPPSSSSPANVYTTTPRSRELSVSKVSTIKSDPVRVAKNMTTQSPSKTKLSQPTESNISQRSLGSVSFSKSTSNSKSKTKSSLASNSSTPRPLLKQARRNVIIKTSEVPSVSKSQHSVVGKSKDSPMTKSGVDTLGHVSKFPDSSVITMGIKLAQSSCSRVGNTQSAVSRLGKPSGLRAPSPSIGYFSQSNSQPSHSAEDKHRQLPRSDVCSPSHFSLIPTFKKPQFSEKVPSVISKSVTRNTGSSATCLSAQYICPKPSQERVKVDLERTQEIESEVSSCSLSSQIYESLQHPCIIQGDTGKLVQDDAATCTSEKISSAKCEDIQSNNQLPPSGCKNSVQDSNISGDDRDEKRKTCCSVEGPFFKNFMDSPVQDPSGHELTLFDNCSQLKVSSPGEEDICTTKKVGGDLDILDVQGEPPSECLHPEDEDEINHFLSGEKDALVVNRSTGNVAKQPEVIDGFTADPDFPGDFPSRKSYSDNLSSSENQLGNTESVVSTSGPAEAPECVLSSCNQFEENIVLNSILCDHNMVCDDQAVLETEKRTEASDITKTNCEADLFGPFSDCTDKFRESEEQHLFCQAVLEGKEGCHEIEVLIRNERADTDDGPDIQIDYFTGSPKVKQNIEQVQLLIPSSTEVKMEDKLMELSHEPFFEKLTSEKHRQDNCHSDVITSSVKAVHVMKQTDQLGTSDGCCPAKDVSTPGFSYSNEELKDNSDLEDMDIVTESDCSDEEFVDNLNESELIGDLNEFSVKGIHNQEYLEVGAIHTADQHGKTKTLLSESIGSPVSIFGDQESLNEDTNLSRISEGMSKESSNSGSTECNSVGKAKIQTDTKEEFGAQVTDQELSSHEEEEEEKEEVSRDAKRKPDPIIVKPQNAVPFSDEWLAAIEAAGEEILTLKSGRVQHSPTEKSEPELGPWSPVKKKRNSQGVGPFDCTKYTNKGIPPTLD